MLANAWRFRSLLRRWRPDVLVTGNWGAIEFAMANLPSLTRHLHVVDGFGPEERETQIAPPRADPPSGAGARQGHRAVAQSGADRDRDLEIARASGAIRAQRDRPDAAFPGASPRVGPTQR